ncbi:DUF2993 domain-containing protein [Leucobacter sp. UCMA 4100]|uniref:LmeA family phospholipid-binding protein n=1 Tax=Leucobacter sp. UCMA 4100 TaxID=2810534 RepID=UPI0022EB0586|nr:DUF2993 domain-containing protein [Leucobacter sp. UCMA 4100]MDA3147780.1 DUF2993 domain-containing protein [Leucobacter sp. UCMA 4100]
MATKRPKKRGWIAAVTTVSILALLLGGTELVMRQVVPKTMADLAREAVGLSEDHPVDVEISGYLTPQVIFGTFSKVQMSAESVPFADGIRASVTANARDLPRDPSKHELGETTLTATFTEQELTEVLQTLSKGVGQRLIIDGDQLSIDNELSLFGQKVPVSVTFEPSVVDHQLHIEPIAVDAAGILSLGVDQLADFPLFADFANGVDICVASYMPAGVQLDGLSLSTTKKLSVTLSADPRIGIDETLQELGSCD